MYCFKLIVTLNLPSILVNDYGIIKSVFSASENPYKERLISKQNWMKYTGKPDFECLWNIKLYAK